MSISTPHTEPNRDHDAVLERTNGLTDEQIKGLLAGAGRRKHAPAYVERLLEGAAEYRRMVREELERELKPVGYGRADTVLDG